MSNSNSTLPRYKMPEYHAYKRAKARCTNKNGKKWKNYGGRGIEFRFDDFEVFMACVGNRPTAKHSLGRIDNDGHYEPGNVRWETSAQQQINRTNNRHLTFNGETKTTKEWAEITGIKRVTIESRIDRYGWSVADALTKTIDRRVRSNSHWVEYQGKQWLATDLAKAHGFSPTVVIHRLLRGWSVHDAISRPVKPRG